jgi:putative oxidoreductase
VRYLKRLAQGLQLHSINGEIKMLSNRVDLAALVLRTTLGGVLLAHGLLKFLVFGLPGSAGFFASVGFPGWMAYVAAPFEVVAGLALMAGFHSRFLAAASLPLLLGAAWVHLPHGWVFSNPGGGWEFPVVLVWLAVGVYLLGDGRYALTPTRQTR